MAAIVPREASGGLFTCYLLVTFRGPSVFPGAAGEESTIGYTIMRRVANDVRKKHRNTKQIYEQSLEIRDLSSRFTWSPRFPPSMSEWKGAAMPRLIFFASRFRNIELIRRVFTGWKNNTAFFISWPACQVRRQPWRFCLKGSFFPRCK